MSAPSPAEYMESTGLKKHLSKVLLHTLDFPTLDPVGSLERISKSIRTQPSADENAVPARVNACKSLARAVKKKVEGEGDEEVPEEEQGGQLDGTASKVGDVLGEHRLLESAGMSLGQSAAYRLCVSLRSLSKQENAEKVTFWGKILGVSSDYFVAEVVLAERGGVYPPPPEESEGEPPSAATPSEDPVDGDAPWIGGTNQFVYYVTSELDCRSWTRLPDVTPAQIASSRGVRRFFTGSLDAAVPSCPPFPGNESNYLRAVIARITHGTRVIPRGRLVVAEEEADPSVADDFSGLPAAELSHAASNNWVHAAAEVLPQGRCKYWAADPSDEPSEEEVAAREAAVERGAAPLSGLKADAAVGKTAAWALRVGDGDELYAPAVARSNRWPGAVAVAIGTTCVNVYIGHGMKQTGRASTNSYAPTVMETTLDAVTTEATDLNEEPPAQEEEQTEE